MEVLGPDHPFRPLGTSRGKGTVALAAVMMFLATFGVVCRTVSRRINRTQSGWDEYMIIISLFFYFTSAIQTCIQVGVYGQALHVWEIPPENLLKVGEVGFFNQISYAFTMASVRFSLLILFRRIFITPRFKQIATGVMVFNGLWFVYNILGVVLRCLPVSKNWDLAETDGYCASQEAIVLSISVWSLLLSLTCWALPIPMVWRLQTNRRKKIALTLLFALGIFDIAVGIVRVITINAVDFKDFTYSEVPALQWLLVEPSVAILCASLPTCRPLIEKIWSSIGINTSSKYSTGTIPRGTPKVSKNIDTIQGPYVDIEAATNASKRASQHTTVRPDSHEAASQYSGLESKDDIELIHKGAHLAVRGA